MKLDQLIRNDSIIQFLFGPPPVNMFAPSADQNPVLLFYDTRAKQSFLVEIGGLSEEL